MRCHPRHELVAYCVLIALSLALVVLQPWYGFFAFTNYFGAERLPERWRPAGIVATAVVVGTSQNGGAPSGEAWRFLVWLVIVGLNIVLASYLMSIARASDRQIDDLTEANRRLEVTLRENAGLHAQLVAQAHEAGVLDERARMAREIHDTLAQGLAGIIRQLEAAAENPSRWRAYHETAERLARESLTEARRSVHALRPEPLVQAALPVALENVARGWSELNRVEASVTTTGEPRAMSADIEVALLRTAQEALTNVAKHAQASRVGVTLSYMDAQVSLDVRDDGVGFSSADGGFGLLGMRERVTLLSGQFSAGRRPEGGFRVAARLPA
jgi:signal transduction histidine kinase